MKNNDGFRSTLMRSMLLRCAVAAVISAFVLAAGFYLAQYIASRFIWQPSPLYSFMHSLENNAPLVLICVWLVVLCFVIYHYWNKTVKYIEAVVAASSALINPENSPIHLPPLLKDVEYSMNQIKQTAIRNERSARDELQRKNDLIVYLAHDIKTPLTSVIGYLSLLNEAQEMPPEQKAKYAGITLEKAHRLDQLIDEFFEITRFNLQHIEVNTAKINLALMLRQMADEFYPMLAPQNKTANVIAPDDLIIFGDADKLSRVFNNILKNAIAYSDSNAAITITAFRENASTIITFANQGDPIPAEKLERVFEKFFRLDAARSSNTGGAGLGLAIAKEIVEAHGGRILASSDTNQTVFTVVLPGAATQPVPNPL